MRTLRKNQQNMYYSLFVESDTLYEFDDDGNKIIDGYTKTGEPIYRETGTVLPHYGTPVKFEASISGHLSEIHAREYGVDQSSIYSEIMTPKGSVPLVYGAKIWKDSQIVWENEVNHIPNADSSDYTIKGILTEFQDYDWYLLQRNN